MKSTAFAYMLFGLMALKLANCQGFLNTPPPPGLIFPPPNGAIAPGDCASNPGYTDNLKLISIKQTDRAWNVPDLQINCPAAFRPNLQKDFDSAILLSVFADQQKNGRLPGGHDCQILPGSLSTSDTSSCISTCGGNSQSQGFLPSNPDCNHNQGFLPDGGQGWRPGDSQGFIPSGYNPNANSQGFLPNGGQGFNPSGFNEWPKTAYVNGVVSYSCAGKGNGHGQGFGPPPRQFAIGYQLQIQYSLSPACQDVCKAGQGFINGNVVC